MQNKQPHRNWHSFGYQINKSMLSLLIWRCCCVLPHFEDCSGCFLLILCFLLGSLPCVVFLAVQAGRPAEELAGHICLCLRPVCVYQEPYLLHWSSWMRKAVTAFAVMEKFCELCWEGLLARVSLLRSEKCWCKMSLRNNQLHNKCRPEERSKPWNNWFSRIVVLMSKNCEIYSQWKLRPSCRKKQVQLYSFWDTNVWLCLFWRRILMLLKWW